MNLGLNYQELVSTRKPVLLTQTYFCDEQEIGIQDSIFRSSKKDTMGFY